ncbi:MAG: hypothetical protein P8M18_11500 [Woeseiaceae bacterium]|nr:hypothetical protein [Woeseiaceae bacterium]
MGAVLRVAVTVRRFCEALALGGAPMLRLLLARFDWLGRLDGWLTRGGAANRSVVSRPVVPVPRRVVIPLSRRSVVVRLCLSDERSRKEMSLRLLVADVRLFSVRGFVAVERVGF